MVAEKAKEILAQTVHRSYPLPDKPWKYFQQWHDTIMLHWETDAVAISKDLPPGIEIDTFNGKAWVSIVIFSVSDLHMREVAAPNFVGTFEEINFRTYVIKNGIPGIYMFSVETDKLVVKWLFRMFSGIPYTKADIKRYGKKIISSHLSKGFSIDFEYESQTPLAKTPLDWWLTERHGLYELISGLWHRYDIHHKPWPLKSCKVKINDVQYHTDHFATDTKPPSVMHYSPSIDVLLWARKEVDNESKS